MKYKFEYIDSLDTRAYASTWTKFAKQLTDEYKAESPSGKKYWTAEFEPEDFLIFKLRFPFLKEYEEKI